MHTISLKGTPILQIFNHGTSVPIGFSFLYRCSDIKPCVSNIWNWSQFSCKQVVICKSVRKKSPPVSQDISQNALALTSRLLPNICLTFFSAPFCFSSYCFSSHSNVIQHVLLVQFRRSNEVLESHNLCLLSVPGLLNCGKLLLATNRRPRAN